MSYDKETGLHYNYHRYYDPKTGRYSRPDPIGLNGGINLFVYADNNSINNIDTNGLFGGTTVKAFFTAFAPVVYEWAPWLVPADAKTWELTQSPTGPGTSDASKAVRKMIEIERGKKQAKIDEIDSWINNQKRVLMLELDNCLSTCRENNYGNVCYESKTWKECRENCIDEYLSWYEETISPQYRIKYNFQTAVW